jgi:hypothetical protein
MPLAMTMPNWSNEVIYVIGWIGVVVIVLFLLLCLTLIPDFIRYIKIKSM